ncbi:MAG: YdeI/OmpD-associated family protein [Terriglobales bacterium]
MPKASKSKPTPVARSFEARLERLRSRLPWIVIRLPFDAAKVWGVSGRIKVRGDVNGFRFRSSLFPTREGWHFLVINKRMQTGARAFEGSVARFQIEVDREERAVTVPDELEHILAEDRSLRRWHDKLNYSTRNEIARWVTEPKSGEARHRRAEQIAERLLHVMEAEREVPPILQVAFARHPQARAGWDAMSASCRRAHLFGIFYYRTPDGQARRIEKMLEEATALGEKISSRKSAGDARRPR